MYSRNLYSHYEVALISVFIFTFVLLIEYFYFPSLPILVSLWVAAVAILVVGVKIQEKRFSDRYKLFEKMYTDLISVSKDVEKLRNDAISIDEDSSKYAMKQRVNIQNIDGSMSLSEQLINNNIRTLDEVLKNVTERSASGFIVMNDMVSAMSTLEQVNDKLQNITDIFQKISTEINIINDIGFKTQLLSFNVFLEAARAGKNGSGFAVIAEEVGQLADSSADAAKSIKELINSSKAYVEDVLIKTSGRIKEVKETSDKAEDIFSDIFSNIDVQIHNIKDVYSHQKDSITSSSEIINNMKDINSEFNKRNDSYDQLRVKLDGGVKQINQVTIQG